jgi:hypothetical protein
LVINGDGTVTDTVTGLMWQRTTTTELSSWEGAIRYCEGLTLAEHDNWRLPNLRELRSIADYSRYNPSIDTTYFPDMVSSYYWSSTTRAYGTGSWAWYVGFYKGHDYGHYKSSHRYVRAVRGGQSRLLDHLIISSPRQGSTWEPGNDLPIRWDTAGLGGTVEISLSRQGGKTGTFETIATGEANDGVSTWTVSGAGSVNCALRIEPTNNPSLGTTQSLFTISEGGGGDCPDCSGDAPVVKDVEFKANTICECKGQTNLTIGPGVKIKKGATVIFKAPKVNVQNGFHAEDGSTVYIKQP